MCGSQVSRGALVSHGETTLAGLCQCDRAVRVIATLIPRRPLRIQFPASGIKLNVSRWRLSCGDLAT
eukprot:COSAG05_NODE_2187_length_3425_cov_3.315995_2_plen_67_part_00